MSVATDSASQADRSRDDYNERVLRNEGELNGQKQLVAETRIADRELINQRSDSLARELERRAEALVTLSIQNREADLRESRDTLAAHVQHVESLREADKERSDLALQLLREVLDTAITENYKQSREAISALEQRREAATEQIKQMVLQWRESDREARVLHFSDLKEHLDRLNHANERQLAFQQNSVTRELWQAEKDAQIAREGVMRDSIISLDRVMSAMNPIALADKAHKEMQQRQDAAIAAASQILSNRIDAEAEKNATRRETQDKALAEIKEKQDKQQGRASGYSALYGWAVAAVASLASIVVVVNLVG